MKRATSSTWKCSRKNQRIERQKTAPINVVIGNPPYSAGQRSANDNNANLKYPTLNKRIAETYAKKSTATNKNSLYDSYLRAFRWATDRIGSQGIVAFISNGGWLDGNTGDGIRLSLAADFTDMYVFNLRGNARTSGVSRQKEGGNVFDSGSRSSVAITIGIKDPTHQGFKIHYRDIGDYLTAAEKLEIVNDSTIQNMTWTEIEPSQHGDWLNQRSTEFSNWPTVGEKKNTSVKRFFNSFSAGLKTGRDSWAYTQTKPQLLENLGRLVETYNKTREQFELWSLENGISAPKEDDFNKFLRANPEYADSTLISWNRTLKNLACKQKRFQFQKTEFIRHSIVHSLSLSPTFRLT